MTAIITPDEIRAKCRNAHPVDALVLLRCAEEIERLQSLPSLDHFRCVMVRYGLVDTKPQGRGLPRPSDGTC